MHHKDGQNVCFPSRVALHDPEGTRSSTKKKVAHTPRTGHICNLLSLKMIKNSAFSNDWPCFLRRYHEICCFWCIFKRGRLQINPVLGICGTFSLGWVKLVRGRTPCCVLATYPTPVKLFKRCDVLMRFQRRSWKSYPFSAVWTATMFSKVAFCRELKTEKLSLISKRKLPLKFLTSQYFPLILVFYLARARARARARAPTVARQPRG